MSPRPKAESCTCGQALPRQSPRGQGGVGWWPGLGWGHSARGGHFREHRRAQGRDLTHISPPHPAQPRKLNHFLLGPCKHSTTCHFEAHDLLIYFIKISSTSHPTSYSCLPGSHRSLHCVAAVFTCRLHGPCRTRRPGWGPSPAPQAGPQGNSRETAGERSGSPGSALGGTSSKLAVGTRVGPGLPAPV